MECMFNTGGKRCELCKKGYEGNALKRTCSKIALNQNLTKCENFLRPSITYAAKIIVYYLIF